MVTGELTEVDGEQYYRIDGVEEMEPFLMTVVSDSDLWMFVSSTGALTAGRTDADHALLPYETDDRLHRAAGTSGPVTLIARTVEGVRQVWQPFAPRVTRCGPRSIAKSVLGDRIVFEERHPDWSLVFRATWAPADAHGWVRTVELRHAAQHDGATVDYEVLDGLLDVMPAGVDALTEQIRSNLVDAYKRSETGPWDTAAVYSLEALITDRAEPAEALTATVVWSSGFGSAELDLDSRAVTDMIAGRPRRPSQLLTGRPGAYLLRGHVTVPRSGPVAWMLVADTGLGHAGVLAATRTAGVVDARERVDEDIARGSRRLRAKLASADGIQTTADPVADAHHLSNVLFNTMRGGVFPHGHQVPVDDLVDFVTARNRGVADAHRAWFEARGPWITVTDLRTDALATGVPDLVRLVLEYLPLTFSRRHGDPSRPWNRFSINVRGDDGRELLAYEGNWRDIFQNWEALLHSYPAYFAHVVAKFVNASTIDGHNPYRISRDGIDWEVPDPDDPWSHIGYWGDHQIVYLLRLLETWEHYEPGAIRQWLERPVFVYADVPYVIADHDAVVADPRDTITYDERHAAVIAGREAAVGADGRLLMDDGGSPVHAGLLEKLLVPALAKLSRFVPGGGIWLNTQRPEWNDANNALAGPGLSMVTLYHLRRYLDVVSSLVDVAGLGSTPLSASVAGWLADIAGILNGLGVEEVDDRQRRAVLDALGRSADAHHRRVRSGSGFEAVDAPVADIRRLCAVAVGHLDRSIRAARRDDGLYHSYNLLSFPTADTAHVDQLGAMLEGQVAVLSSGALDGEGALAVVDALFASRMYRADQGSFMLYPATELRPFLERNVLSRDATARVRAMGPLDGPLGRVFAEDAEGGLHFHASLVNAKALDQLLDRLELTDDHRGAIRDIYEQVFEHHAFTGRSGSMYGYEGIGSIYWHMVAKLLLAVQEAYWTAVDQGEQDDVVSRLADAYRLMRDGLGFRKDPEAFGAFPTDCYSHTPAHAGAQQPGMTGQVKEEVITRRGELGLRVIGGCATLAPGVLAADEVFPAGPDGRPGTARFSVCAVPVTVSRGPADGVTIVRSDGTRDDRPGRALPAAPSRELFARAGTIARVEWTVGPP